MTDHASKPPPLVRIGPSAEYATDYLADPVASPPPATIDITVPIVAAPDRCMHKAIAYVHRPDGMQAWLSLEQAEGGLIIEVRDQRARTTLYRLHPRDLLAAAIEAHEQLAATSTANNPAGNVPANNSGQQT